MLWVVSHGLLGHYWLWLLLASQICRTLPLQEPFKPFAEELAVDEVLGDAKGLCLEQVLAEVRLQGLRPSHVNAIGHDLTHLRQQVVNRELLTHVLPRVLTPHHDPVSIEDFLWAQVDFFMQIDTCLLVLFL